jgi:hypothetical protein
MNDAKEYSDTFDFLYFKKQVKGAMVKSFKDLNVFSVSEEDPDPIPDLLNSNGMRQVCLDPVKKWKDKEDEEWWEQRSWFVCDKLLTFALVFPGKDRDSWLIQDHRFTNDYKAQPWYMAEVTEETKWIDLTQKLTHASPAVVDILELSNQLSSFRI